MHLNIRELSVIDTVAPLDNPCADAVTIVNTPVEASYSVPASGVKPPEPPVITLTLFVPALINVWIPVKVLFFPVNWLAISSIIRTLLVLDSL